VAAALNKSAADQYRGTAKQIKLAQKCGFDIDKLMPEPDSLPYRSCFRRSPGGSSEARRQDHTRCDEVGIPRHMEGKSGKPIISYVTSPDAGCLPAYLLLLPNFPRRNARVYSL
jgi:hypothetical protein